MSSSTAKNKLRLLLVGATGAGKSSSGNTIFRASDKVKGKLFHDGQWSSHNTKDNQEYTRKVLGREVTIVDTPGLHNDKEKAEDIIREVRAAIENSDDPYDAMLFIINYFKSNLEIDSVTLEVLKEAKEKISESFLNHTVFVFTYQDNYDNLQEEVRGEGYEKVHIPEYVAKGITSSKLNVIGPYVKQVGGKEAVASLNNMEEDKEEIKKMVEKLFQAVDFVRKRNDYRKFDKEQLSKEWKENKKSKGSGCSLA